MTELDPLGFRSLRHVKGGWDSQKVTGKVLLDE